jgi:diguanylate cyclase (GGDEF)-like protein
MYATLAKGEVWQGEVRNRAKDGSHYWVHAANAAVRDADGKLTGYMSLRLDITENKKQQAQLAARSLQLDMALEHMPAGFSMFDAAQRLIVCNKRYAEMYDLPPSLTMSGTPLADLMRHSIGRDNVSGTCEELEELRKVIAAFVAQLASGEPFTYTHALSDGRSLRVGTGPMSDGGWVDVHEDVTDKLRMEERIAHFALHDGLTDLPNRALLRERLELALASAQQSSSVAVLCLDLDRFKEVNDTLGHGVGDALLIAVAERLRGCLRKTDTVARVGGDEFVVLQISADPLEEAAMLSQRLLEKISAPYDLDGHQVIIGTSIGIAVSPRDGTEPEMLLENADIAMYRSKTAGRGTFHFFGEDMDAQHKARRSLERDLRMALVRGEFELDYQPIVNLRRDEIAACEALLRWRHPERGLIAPSGFIPLAEETGLITPIGDWVLRHACAEATSWPAHVKVAINFSAVQFKDRNLPKMVFNALAASGLPAERLEIEITESVLFENAEAVLAMLEEIHSFGVRIVLDDFGTGHSSLGYLRTFPFDKIKIDRSFVSDMSGGSEAARAIVRAVACLGKDLGIATVAEGVETEDQLRHVRDEGCNEMQGFLFARPASAAALSRLFAERAERIAEVA